MNQAVIPDAVRLTEFSHGGGCGCKIAPSVLRQMLKDSPAAGGFPHLLVGTQSGDDAAIYRLNAEQALVATTDFFMPIVDDAFDFGRIAATNALSDIYAMGGKPILALAIVGMPINKLPVETIKEILAGGQAACAAAGIPLAGGHSIDSPEPIYGLAALGLVHPDKVMRNDTARAGDALVLGKPLGIGIYGAALKKGRLSDEGYREMLASTIQLNTPGPALAELPGVHALTDVTGFGLLGHLIGICRGSALGARISYSAVPVFPLAAELAQQGFVTGASERNWLSYADETVLPEGMPAWQRKLLCDPQTSGGLLACCSGEAVPRVLQTFKELGFAHAAKIGEITPGPAQVTVVP
jgi:selenide,water dikinase